jgi:hypothetical protein
MSVFTKPAAAKAVRWSAVPAGAALAVVLAAGPALAAGTSVGIYTNGSVTAGQISLTGAYQCAADAPYAELTVTATQMQRHGHGRTVESSSVQRVDCTGATREWAATLSPRVHDGWFAAGDTRVVVRVATPGDRRGQADASLVLNATAS